MSRPPLSNGRALLITLGAGAVFFVLFLLIPGPHQTRRTSTLRPAEIPKVAESPAVLFATRCTQCHALPALTHRSPDDWRILVLKMNRYMKQTGRQSLSEEEAGLVTRYIVQNQK